MFRSIRKQVRPNTSVVFFDPPTAATTTPEFKQYMWENYMSTGKLITIDNTLSEDGLSLVNTTIWDSEASAIQFKDDPVVVQNLFNEQTIYCDANGITQEFVSKEEI